MSVLSPDIEQQNEEKLNRMLYGVNPVKRLISSLLITSDVLLIKPEIEIDVREILEGIYPKNTIKEFSFISVKSFRDILAQLWQAQQNGYKTWIFRYIDSIPDSPDHEAIEEMIRIGLKPEGFPFSDGEIDFENTRILATCSNYPEYLAGKSIGAIVIDVPNEIEENIKEQNSRPIHT
ncbi:MAG: hypothetical protein K2H47_06825 [Muribaculaceae bacterium]|nr:hypothetical protein [Muribaculaceae bacterium]